MCHNIGEGAFGHTPSEDLAQPAHTHSLIRTFTWHILDRKDAKFLLMDNQDSDLTAQMQRLIWKTKTEQTVCM